MITIKGVEADEFFTLGNIFICYAFLSFEIIDILFVYQKGFLFYTLLVVCYSICI